MRSDDIKSRYEKLIFLPKLPPVGDVSHPGRVLDTLIIDTLINDKIFTKPGSCAVAAHTV